MVKYSYFETYNYHENEIYDQPIFIEFEEIGSKWMMLLFLEPKDPVRTFWKIAFGILEEFFMEEE